MKEKPIMDQTKRQSVWDYPRPPAVEDVPQQIKIIFNGESIVDTENAKRVLETSHPPTYYIPLQDIKIEALQPAPGRTFCEWKGEAKYYDVVSRDRTAKSAAWFYPNPNPDYLEIKDYVAFYASEMDACFVGDKRVEAQEGIFYGGWITSDIDGPFKGGPETAGW